MSLYIVLKTIMKTALGLFYKRVRMEGVQNIPIDKPLLIIPNHQNALIDPLLVGSFFPFPIHFLARADVFTKKAAPFLKKLNMMPIYRIRDGFKSLSANDAIFEACRGLFAEGKSVMIFPEGNHGEHHFLRPLTKGAARMALSAQEAMDQELFILPVGINYFSHRRPRTTVLIRFEKPIGVSSFLASYQENTAKGLQKMRDAMSEGMKKTLVIAEETQDYFEKKNQVFQESNGNKSFEELRAIEASKEIKKEKRKKNLIARILNPIPFLLIGKKLVGTKDIVFYATIKYAMGLFLFPIWWIFVFIILSLSFSWEIAALAIFVMVFGLFYSYRNSE